MARYNHWMNGKLYTSAALLTDGERKRDRGAFFKSIHATLNHLLVADRIWLGRIAGKAPPAGYMAEGIQALDQELHSDFAELRSERENTDAALLEWASSLTSEALAGPLRFIRRGAPMECPLWWIAMHVFNHGTHHRGQVTTLLVQAGQDPGSTDVFAMLVEESAAASPPAA